MSKHLPIKPSVLWFLLSSTACFPQLSLTNTDYLTSMYKFQLYANFSRHTKRVLQNMSCPLASLTFSHVVLMPGTHFPPLFILPFQLTQFKSSDVSSGVSPSPLFNRMCAAHLLYPSAHSVPPCLL